MPVITVEGPPADLEKKRKLVSGMAEVAAGAYGLPKDIMVVIIRENSSENVGAGGELISDRQARKGG